LKRVLVILPNAFELLEGAAFIDVLGWANQYGSVPIEVVTAGLTSEVKCTFGSFRIVPDMVLTEVVVDEFDAVALPGGFESEGYYEEAYSDILLNTLREFNKQQKPIASICVGALPLAKSGILASRKATTYHLSGGKRRKQLRELGAFVVDEPIVVDGNVTTSTSPATAIEVALKLVEQLTNIENTELVRREFGLE
jgi:4-methyl-5(b-hydroxyethyl)-thiazole monophosphate biosynthesis